MYNLFSSIRLQFNIHQWQITLKKSLLPSLATYQSTSLLAPGLVLWHLLCMNIEYFMHGLLIWPGRKGKYLPCMPMLYGHVWRGNVCLVTICLLGLRLLLFALVLGKWFFGSRCIHAARAFPLTQSTFYILGVIMLRCPSTIALCSSLALSLCSRLERTFDISKLPCEACAYWIIVFGNSLLRNWN